MEQSIHLGAHSMALALAIALSVGRPSPDDQKEYSLDAARAILEQTLVQGEPRGDPREILAAIHQAGEKGYTALTETLHAVVETFGDESDNNDLAWFAMLALLDLGEPLIYYQNLAGDTKRPRLAGYSLLILASYPTPDLKSQLIELRDSGEDRGKFFSDCVYAALHSIVVIDKCKALEAPADKAAALLGEAMRGFSLMTMEGNPYLPFDGAAPCAIWARRELRSFGAEHPQEVADAYTSIDAKLTYPNARSEDFAVHLTEAMKAYAYGFLPDEVKALVDQ